MSRFRRRWAPRLAAVGSSAWRRATGVGVASMLAITPLGVARSWMEIPQPAHRSQPGQPVPRGSFSRIVLPDLVVIESHGLTAAQVARLGRLPQVHGALAVDGASIAVSGHRVNVIGVNLSQYRSWTPLRTASDQRLWTALADGGFAASPAAARRLGLRVGRSYRIGGASAPAMVFAGARPFGIAGVDLVVADRATPRLGLIPNVATLVSAPGLAMPALEAEVKAALRASAPHGRAQRATLVGMRPQQLPVDASGGSGRPATYLELFRRSAALYCPGMSWTVLAAIGQIESGDGANVGPSSAGALGPMQFLPSTWAAWGISAFGEPGPPNIMDPYDAVPSAARYLCAAGAGSPAGLRRAIYAYNHANWYVNEVLALAAQYARAYG